jgi:DNA gyrase subunit A
MGKYHPHGDTAIYDTIVRMAQPFSMRYLLVDGQGNFGSVDGDAPAAMRYTEIRMSRLAQELLSDLEKETVDFTENYDGNEHEPAVLPTRVPNLLVNGSTGIAVGMATNIPPHNLGEVISACVALIDNPDIDLLTLMQHLPGPDFPTAGVISGARGIREAYRTGRGRIFVRALTHTEDLSGGREAIVVTELPYMVNKARLLEKIAQLVKARRLEGISELRDESDKDGMRMVIELRRGENTDVVLNNLYQLTAMQSVFGINMVALIDGQPKQLDLKEILQAFVRHRREVVTRRSVYDLRKARERAHNLEGLAVALSNIDPVIQLIKECANPAEAKAELVARVWEPGMVTDMLQRTGSAASRPDNLDAQFGLHEDGYHLSDVQAQAILDLRLHRLTGLEQEKIVNDYAALLDKIDDLLDILNDPDRLLNVIREELTAIGEEYGDARRTEIQTDHYDLTVEDLISDEEVVVTFSHAGYAKAQPLSDYTTQRRGGRGKSAARVKEEDFIDKLFVASTHDTLLCFSSRGKVYWKKVYELPVAGRSSRGRPLVNLLPLEDGERINALLPVRDYTDDQFIFMATSSGVVKKTPLSHFSRPRANGIIAVDLRGEDYLVGVALTDGEQDVMLFSSAGKAVRFSEKDVRAMGRVASGVRGIRLSDGHRVIALIIVGEGDILTVTRNGFGKRTPVTDYPRKGRGAQGVIDIKTTTRNGSVVGAVQVSDDDEIMLISSGGTLVRTTVEEISSLGRNTQGVKLIRLDEGETVAELERVAALDGDDELAEPPTLH